MDAFIQRYSSKLFERDLFLLLVENIDLTTQIQTFGGQIVPLNNSNLQTNSTPLIVLINTTATTLINCKPVEIEMIKNLKLKYRSLSLVKTQWINDCIAKKLRLPFHAYCISTLLQNEYEPAIKKQKIEKVSYTETTITSIPISFLPSKELLPHLRPWKEYAHQSLYILNARTKEQMHIDKKKKIAIAGFDMDGTLITTKSGKKFAQHAKDWKLFHPTKVRTKLQNLVANGYHIVIFSNQNGITKGHTTIQEIQCKVEAILQALNVPALVVLATKDDIMRKPRIGGWNVMLHEFIGIDLGSKADTNELDIVDKSTSFYCGDGAGRPKVAGRSKDFAASDYKFALNLGIKFHTPEDLFLESKQRVHTHPELWDVGYDPRTLRENMTADCAMLDTMDKQEIVILVGSPATGKSYLATNRFDSTKYTIINQDTLKTVSNCVKVGREALEINSSIIIDNTNSDCRTRKIWIDLAKEKGISIRCIELDVTKPLALHLNKFRSLTEDKKIPEVAIHTFYKNIIWPKGGEGFDQVQKIPFQLHASRMAKDKIDLICSYL